MFGTINDCKHEERSADQKVRTVFLLGSCEREALERLSANSGAPVSELLRRSVALYLTEKSA
jgi:hypothetical protein